MSNPVYKSVYFVWHVLKRFYQDDCMYRASALTYTTLLALVPLMTVGFSVFMAFPHFKSWGLGVQNFIFENFVPASGKMVQSYLQGFVEQASNLSMIGLIFLVITAVLMLFTIEATLNHIWRVDKPRRGVMAFLMYWTILTMSPILLGASIALSTYFMSLSFVADTARTFNLSGSLLPLIPFILSVIAFAILYVVIPNCRVPVRYACVGALVTALLFSVAKFGFTLYVAHFPTYKLLYGTFAVVPLFLVWVYLMWLIILFGAELTHSLTYRHMLKPGKPLDRFTHAFLWLGYLWQAQQQGKALTIDELANQDAVGYELAPEGQVKMLLRKKLIGKTPEDRYTLARDLSQMSLLELHQILPWKLPVDLNTNNLWLKRLSEDLTAINKFIEQQASYPVTSYYRHQAA